MARIPRVTQSIFAGSATNNGVFGSAQANSGPGTISSVLATIMGLPAWATGWVNAVIGGSKFPPLEEFQALEYVHSTQIAYILQQGIPEYDAGTNYFVDNIVCKAGTFQLYGSITNGNEGNALTDGTNWKLLIDLSSPANKLAVVSKAFTAGAYTVLAADINQINYFSATGTVNISPATVGAGNTIAIAVFGGGGPYNLTITASSGIILTGTSGITGKSMNLNAVANNAFKVVMFTSDGTNLYAYSTNNVEANGSSQPVLATKRFLAVTWASNTTVSLSAAELTLQDQYGESVKAVAQSITFNSATSGAGGLDTGSIAASTWYYGYMIYNPTTNTYNSLFSTNSNTPTLPAGYIYASGVITCFRTDGSNNFIGFTQYGDNWQYKVGSNLSTGQRIASGSAGSTSTPTYVAIAISNFVPYAWARTIKLYLTQITNAATVVPNNSYGANQSATNAPVFGANGAGSQYGELVLESTNIYWASDSNASLFCLGFTLNI